MQLCSKFDGDYQTLLVFVPASIVFNFYSFDICKKIDRKTENRHFLEN